MIRKLELFGIKKVRNIMLALQMWQELYQIVNKQAYWRKLKQRLKEEGNETVTNCHTLKLKAQDGKYRMTDVTDIEGMFRISQTESK